MPRVIHFKFFVMIGSVTLTHAWDNVIRDYPGGVNLRNFPFPLQSSTGAFPSDWPGFGKCKGCPVNDDPTNCARNCPKSSNTSDPTCCNFAGQSYPNQWPNNNLTYPNVPGYGFLSWSAWAKSHEEGANVSGIS
jgi:hypothetical protein